MPTAIEFRSKLRFNQHHLIITKKQSLLTRTMEIFPSEKIYRKKSIELICIFLSINQQYKLMKKDAKTEMKEKN